MVVLLVTSIDDFITKYAAGTHTGYFGNDCVLTVRCMYLLKTGCSSASVSIASTSDSGVESLDYEVKTLGSSKIIISEVPNKCTELNPDDVPIGGKILFAAVPTYGMGLVDESTNPSGVGILRNLCTIRSFKK